MSRMQCAARCLPVVFFLLPALAFAGPLTKIVEQSEITNAAIERSAEGLEQAAKAFDTKIARQIKAGRGDGAAAAETGNMMDFLEKLGVAGALESAGASERFKGEAGRSKGASGALADLLLNSGELICSGWIIGFRAKANRFMTSKPAGGIGPSHEATAVVQQLLTFSSRVYEECARRGLLAKQGLPPKTPKPAHSTGEIPTVTTLAPAVGEDWSAKDRACADRCVPLYRDYKSRAARVPNWRKRVNTVAARVKRTAAGTHRVGSLHPDSPQYHAAQRAFGRATADFMQANEQMKQNLVALEKSYNRVRACLAACRPRVRAKFPRTEAHRNEGARFKILTGPDGGPLAGR